MKKMNGICLNRTAEVYGYVQVVRVVYQFFQTIFIALVQQKTEAAFSLVFTKKNNRSFKIRIFQKRVGNQQDACCGTVHTSKLTNLKENCLINLCQIDG